MHQKDSWVGDPERQGPGRRLALYRELESKVASGEALELKEVIVGLVGGGGTLVFLIEEDSLAAMLNVVDGGFMTKDAIRFPIWQSSGACFDFRLRLENLCFVQVSENRYFLVDGKIILFERAEVARLQGADSAPAGE